MTRTSREDIERLNYLLKLPSRKLLTLTDEQWASLFDGLHVALFGEGRQRGKSDDFHFAISLDKYPRSQISQAQLLIREFLSVCRKGGEVVFQLERHRFYVAPKATTFGTAYRCEDVKTMIYLALFDLLRTMQIAPRDFLVCAAPDCGASFVPLRKPHRGQRTFCSVRCQNRILAKESRQGSDKEARRRERERGRRRYEARVRKQLPGAKIQRRAGKG